MNLSLVIPVYNEEGNLEDLVKRIDKSLKSKTVAYEMIFIDDDSEDNSVNLLKSLALYYPLNVFKKKFNKRGKSSSLIEGLSHTNYDVAGFIDGDLQYPPESIPKMLEKMNDGYDIIVANRKEYKENKLRKILSRTYRGVFSKFIYNLNCDIQSGLKIFKKEIFNKISMNPTPWTFDLEFLVKGKNLGYKIGSIDIEFAKRKWGKSKVNILNTSLEIFLSSLRLKYMGNKSTVS